MTLKETALLPAGFHDLLPEEATLKADMTYELGRKFQHHGYMRVSPPLVEFEASLFASAGESLKHQVFRLLDPLSHKMMGIRADITTQVARIATTRLTNEPTPIRLSYVGDVLHVKGKGLYASRLLTQAGIELIGSDHNQADTEVILTCLEALEELDIQNISIDFTIPTLTDIIINTANLPADQCEKLEQALNKKNSDAIKELGGKAADTLVALTMLPPNALDALKALSKIKLPDAAHRLCNDLENIIALIRKAKPNVHTTIDLVEYRGFKYHTGVCFSIFSTEESEEVGAGGRYIITNDNGTVDAVGGTLYINTLLRIVKPRNQAQKIYILPDTPYEEANNLRNQSYITICALENNQDPVKAAKAYGCQFIYQNGKVEKI